MNSGTSDFLNASRWIAAFLVVLGHVFSISMAHYYDIPDRSLVLRGLHFFSGFGHTAVIVFFCDKWISCRWTSYSEILRSGV